MSNTGTKFILADRFTFDPTSNSLVDKDTDNENVRLGSNESRILLMLSQRPNEVITRNELHDFVWREQGFEVDDSSLTQAISTLRKMLKDSTKSPQFVKTVPKRGYQLIATVESVQPDASKDPDAIEQSDESYSSAVSSSELASQAAVSEAVITQTSPSVDSTPAAPKPRMDLFTKLILLVAVILPICVILFTTPSQSKFRRLAVFNDVIVSTPINHPDLTSWLPLIESCVRKYGEMHTGELAPKEVIATGGHSNQLVLNYIHTPQFSGENITLRIFANQEDVSKICQ
ncbi:winged helix-turn-helix domain-containing protein [Vibrio fluvialis]|jgi:cholera toxin transcriptional activator|uniref:transcriptional regulator n=1 Tax=Vibrio TaxID=662 RepID=UPI0006E1771D|nr:MULTISPECIES: transcriptional regulator [Vibrio]EKO3371149.1 winged helix-turn-helix domain-containing protein [Vibrio fluvialis]EKO3448833.1 winged helix-turn-helix domain-containing protein [Vibrio fluvialis]EKO3450393.1 winged helix-turn-helix domain-containing protein [Vibrio fluvialis]EKO3459479.1 winged helix-turn-helix domain-containing protein [Vibrio fluvialis]EKO3462804.1 winged helix-turn-helix domain-containing protein [Vibrio fluvialis]